MNTQKKMAKAMTNNSELMKEFWSVKKALQTANGIETIILEERLTELKNILKL